MTPSPDAALQITVNPDPDRLIVWCHRCGREAASVEITQHLGTEQHEAYPFGPVEIRHTGEVWYSIKVQCCGQIWDEVFEANKGKRHDTDLHPAPAQSIGRRK